MSRHEIIEMLRRDGYLDAVTLIEGQDEDIARLSYHNATKGFANPVAEFCSNCESEIEMSWNTTLWGYKAFCPVCGNRLMLCDECRHGDNGGCDYDSATDTCKFNKKEAQI